jgi:hypothetical protein
LVITREVLLVDVDALTELARTRPAGEQGAADELKKAVAAHLAAHADELAEIAASRQQEEDGPAVQGVRAGRRAERARRCRRAGGRRDRRRR